MASTAATSNHHGFFLGSVWIFDCQIWFRMELILFDKTIFKTITIIRNTNDSCSNAQGQACFFVLLRELTLLSVYFEYILTHNNTPHLHIKYIKCNNCSYRITLNWNVKDTPPPRVFHIKSFIQFELFVCI